jgi:outer membrane protein assembly factor BamB
VYAFGANGRTLEAHAPANGNLLWTVDLGNSDFSNVIVTRNLAFVSSSTATQAVDLNTRKVVWTYPQGGNLAISQRGVLYILTSAGKLAAVNLR